MESNNTVERLENILKKQDGKCYICCGDIEYNCRPDCCDSNNCDCKEDIVITLCNHSFHKDCLYETYLSNKDIYKKKNIRECPYCRSHSGWFPLKDDEVPEIYIHKNFQNIKRCEAILKSGKRKGEECNCIIKNIEFGYCGRHKNYKPSITKKKEVDDSVEFIYILES